MKLKKVRSMLLALVLTCSMVATPVFAAPEDEGQSAESLESQKAAVQSEVNDLQTQLNTLLTKMNELEGQLITKGQEIVQAKEDLVVAEEKKQQQYEDMKLRIKYMYEEGDGSALERIMASGSVAEVLSQVEYVEKVHTYDRNMLQEYANTVTEVEELKTTLEEDMVKLQTMEAEYQVQSNELSTTLDSKRAEVENLDAMIQEAARAAEQARLEAERKAAEEAAARQAAEESAAQQPDAGNGAVNNGGGTVDNGGDGGSGSGTVAPAPVPEPSYSAATGNAVVDRAYGWVGRAEYVWGACSPGAFDCSGFVSYCLTGNYARLGTTYTFLSWPRVSDPQPGDVCVNESHCGIYIGGGLMIHAATYGVGVITGPVQGGMVYVRY